MEIYIQEVSATLYMSMRLLDVKEKVLAQSCPSSLQRLNNFHMHRLHKTYGTCLFARDKEEHEANGKIGCVL